MTSSTRQLRNVARDLDRRWPTVQTPGGLIHEKSCFQGAVVAHARVVIRHRRGTAAAKAKTGLSVPPGPEHLPPVPCFHATMRLE